MNSNILAGLAGITSDANSLVNFARNSAQRHLFTYNEDIPVEMLVQGLCNMKQGYTQFGGTSLLSSLHLSRALPRNLGKPSFCKVSPDLPLYEAQARLTYTESIGLRPFGVALLYTGWDPLHGFQLYQSDPSGNYSGWKATCIGANHSSATSLLKQDYKDDLTLDDAMQLCLKVMSKTMDSTKLGSEKRKF